ncbi:Slp family lipoprotein [Thiobaca trueperi]|uniref:Outer membrane lipoprotein n=1 Tax=Thiobaca trueperi TaxID=127458 RepID=A0A4R3MYP8_9GAMM|nr:Slp family lipoprotein [Thiobaca trueperi]TCT21514.1 outer membrane lipoprotein [Thiobaca trueperi]
MQPSTVSRLVLPMLVCTLCAAVLSSGCATQEDCFKPVGQRGLTPASAALSPRAEGEMVTWGGMLLDTRNLETHTELEVMGYRLDGCGRPLVQGESQGRFLIRHPGYLEPLDYRTGRPVTATGRLAGVSDGWVGAAAVSLPVLDAARLRLWPAPPPVNEQLSPFPVRPRINIGIGGGSGHVGGGIGVSF